MLARIFSVVGKDVRAALRENMVTYMVISPIFLALVMRAVLPQLTGFHQTFAVQQDVPPAVMAAFKAHGDVEVMPDAQALQARVEALDDVPGITMEHGRVAILLEGNEQPFVREMPPLVLATLDGPRIDVRVDDVGRNSNELPLAAGALMAFSVLLICGLVAGFSILAEKESGVLRFYDVTPVRFGEYLLAKVLVVAAMVLVLPAMATWVVLGTLPLGPFLLAVVAALPTGLVLGFFVGALAENQLGAVALLKGLLLVFTGVPLVGLAVDGRWKMLVAPFGNHWAVQTFLSALRGDDALLGHAALALALTAPWLVLVVVLMRRRLGLVHG